MGLFTLLFRDMLTSRVGEISKTATVDEFDNLTNSISGWALVEHNEDGTHNLIGSGYNFIPVGAMVRWQTTVPPTGWLLTNGAAISRAAYPKLFSTIGISAGSGDGVSTFNLPNVANFIILAA